MMDVLVYPYILYLHATATLNPFF